MTASSILSCRGLCVSVLSDQGRIGILKGIDLSLQTGHILGIAGESGCGKTTLIRTILGILPRHARIDRGGLLFKDRPVPVSPRGGILRGSLGRCIGFIPQDPYLALNPVFKIGTQMMEILRWNGLPGEAAGTGRLADRKLCREHLIRTLAAVELPDPGEVLERYPHQFSGGQRQRILIASALIARPEVILADEPTTALDVTTQKQILTLLRSLVSEFGISMMFVTHDFGVISELCDDVAVMHAGCVVETGPTRRVIDAPEHPYTRHLIDSHPDRGGILLAEDDGAMRPPA